MLFPVILVWGNAMRVEYVRVAHLGYLAEIEALCFPDPWSREALALLVSDKAFGLACIDEETEQVLAYVGVLTVLDEGQILNVATHPAWRRRGLADALLTALINEAEKKGLLTLSLEVRESNTAAIALYEKHGFAVAGKRPRFYTHPTEAALVMLRNL